MSKRIFYMCADDLGIWGDLFVVAETKEEATQKFLDYYAKKISKIVEDITDSMTEEEYEEMLKEQGVVEEH